MKFVISVFVGLQCVCGADKDQQTLFCKSCWHGLTRELKAPFSRQVSKKWIKAFAEACKHLGYWQEDDSAAVIEDFCEEKAASLLPHQAAMLRHLLKIGKSAS